VKGKFGACRDYNKGEGPEATVLEVAREAGIPLPANFHAQQLQPEVDIVHYDLVRIFHCLGILLCRWQQHAKAHHPSAPAGVCHGQVHSSRRAQRGEPGRMQHASATGLT
jgi:hypothetical protein